MKKKMCWRDVRIASVRFLYVPDVTGIGVVNRE